MYTVQLRKWEQLITVVPLIVKTPSNPKISQIHPKPTETSRAHLRRKDEWWVHELVNLADTQFICGWWSFVSFSLIVRDIVDSSSKHQKIFVFAKHEEDSGVLQHKKGVGEFYTLEWLFDGVQI